MVKIGEIAAEKVIEFGTALMDEMPKQQQRILMQRANAIRLALRADTELASKMVN